MNIRNLLLLLYIFFTSLCYSAAPSKDIILSRELAEKLKQQFNKNKDPSSLQQAIRILKKKTHDPNIRTDLGNLYYHYAGQISQNTSKQDDLRQAFNLLKNKCTLNGFISLSQIYCFGYHSEDGQVDLEAAKKVLHHAINLVEKELQTIQREKEYSSRLHNRGALQELKIKEEGSNSIYAAFCTNLGNLYVREKNYTKGIDYYEKVNSEHSTIALNKVLRNLKHDNVKKELIQRIEKILSSSERKKGHSFRNEASQLTQSILTPPTEAAFLENKKEQVKIFLKKYHDIFSSDQSLESTANILVLFNIAAKALYQEWIDVILFDKIKLLLNTRKSALHPAHFALAMFDLYFSDCIMLIKENSIEEFQRKTLDEMNLMVQELDGHLDKLYFSLASLNFYALDKRDIAKNRFKYLENLIQEKKEVLAQKEESTRIEVEIKRAKEKALKEPTGSSNKEEAKASKESMRPKAKAKSKAPKKNGPTLASSARSDSSRRMSSAHFIRNLGPGLKEAEVLIENSKNGVKFLFLNSVLGEKARENFLELYTQKETQFINILDEIINWRPNFNGTGRPEVLKGNYTYGIYKGKKVFVPRPISRRLGRADRIVYKSVKGHEQEIFILEVGGHYTSR